MDRVSKLLHGLNLIEGRGLEIGPLVAPILRRPQHHVFYVDHVATEALKRKYEADPAVSTDAIASVDVVWAAGSLRAALDVTGLGDLTFDHVVASHVVEHVPNLVGWLGSIAAVLNPGGALRLIVPDRRFTMDVARRETGIADVLAAEMQARSAPSTRDILDFYLNYRAVDPKQAWAGIEPGHDGIAVENLEIAEARAAKAAAGDYQDVHCSVFTPRSFSRLMRVLADCRRQPFACERIFDTAPDELDFFVHLVRSDDEAAVRTSWDRALALMADGVTLEQDDASALRRAFVRFRKRADRQARLEADVAHLRQEVARLSSGRVAARSVLAALRRKISARSVWRTNSPRA